MTGKYVPRQQLTPNGPVHGGFTVEEGPPRLTPAGELSLAGQELCVQVKRLIDAITKNPDECTSDNMLSKLDSMYTRYHSVYNAQLCRQD